MLIGFSDRHHRQHQRRAVGWHQFDCARHDAGVDRGVDPHRQMRSVLLNRGDGKDRNHTFRVEAGEVLRRQIPPPMRFQNHGYDLSDFEARHRSFAGRVRPLCPPP